ncbi:MAG: hypothetical protein MJK15_03055 [Colwellia sp.]|nr:hypothetical protein [Colwellia sp.]
MLNINSIQSIYSGKIHRPSSGLIDKLSIEDRHNLIIDLAKTGERTIGFLAEKARVTLATIRLDIIYLMDLNKVKDISKTPNSRLIVANEN